MIDGDKTNPPPPSPPSPDPHEFSHAAAKLAVSRICERVGYTHFKSPPLESLTTAALSYIVHLGELATSFANLTGRSQCNVFDVILALEEVNGNVTTLDSVTRSVRLREIIDYVALNNEEEEITQPLPKLFPVARNTIVKTLSFEEVGEMPPGKHIPVWLPAFPDPHTYKETPMWVEKVLDPRKDKKEQAKQRRRGERALLSLQRKLIGSANGDSTVWGDLDGVRCVSPSRERDGFSLLEVFAPALEEGVGDDVGGEKKRGCGVLAKLRSQRKFLGEPLELGLVRKGEEREMSFVREEDRDDKRRRAEFILRQCMENPVDLNQL